MNICKIEALVCIHYVTGPSTRGVAGNRRLGNLHRSSGIPLKDHIHGMVKMFGRSCPGPIMAVSTGLLRTQLPIERREEKFYLFDMKLVCASPVRRLDIGPTARRKVMASGTVAICLHKQIRPRGVVAFVTTWHLATAL